MPSVGGADPRNLPRRPSTGVWLSILCGTLFGYAILGKTVAYVGIPPLYLSEITLALGIVAALRAGTPGAVLTFPGAFPALLFALWGVCRTVPFLAEYRVDALRDAVVWGYMTIAFVLFALADRKPEVVGTLLRRYSHVAPLFLVTFPVLAVLVRYLGVSGPEMPWSGMPLLQIKAGDMLVHTSGAASFLYVFRLNTRVPWRVIAAVDIFLLAAINRGGLLAVAAVVLVVVALDRNRGRIVVFAIIAGFLLAVAFIADVRVTPLAGGRELSVRQLAANVASIYSDSDDVTLAGSREWRLTWWRAIVDYAVFGEYRWDGKGYGLNLADADGFQVTSDGSLRSPHNSHLTILARGGLPAAILWMTLLAISSGVMLVAYKTARQRSADMSARAALWTLSYFVAILVNAAFDVSLEGPMMGLWFWSVWGLGMIVARQIRADARSGTMKCELMIAQALASPTSRRGQPY